MMRILTGLAALGLLAGTAACAGGPFGNQQRAGATQWEYDGQRFATREQCLQARNAARDRSTVAGAVGGAATGALAGGNVAETALAAGVGAAAGNIIAGQTRRC